MTPIAAVNDSPTYDHEEELPDGVVVHDPKFKEQNRKATGDELDEASKAEEEDKAAYEAWKAQQTPKVAPPVDPAYEAWKAEQEAKAQTDTVGGSGTEEYKGA